MIEIILFFVIAFWALMGFCGMLYCRTDNTNYFLIIFFALIPIIGIIAGIANV